MSSKTIRPPPPLPDQKEYENLTEKQRQLAGYPYRNVDAELTKDRVRARRLCRQYNETTEDQEELREKILKELFHPDCADKKITIIEPSFRCDYGYNITVGNNLQMNFDCCFLDCAQITIGDNCLMAPGVHIYAGTHPLDAKYRQDNDDYRELAFPVKVGDNVWIGGQAIICPGVTVGDNVVIGAGSVVTKDVPSNVVVAGNPAKIIRYMEGGETPAETRG